MAHRRHAAGTAGIVFHVINRGVRRWRLFETDLDYQTCLQLLGETRERYPVDLYAYCLMPNHFHLVVRPTVDGQLSKFMQWFTATHSRRWHLLRGTTGTGSVYQGRFRAFPVQTDEHFLTVCRYVERNPLRAKLVARAEDWAWSSMGQRRRSLGPVRLARWPLEPDGDWCVWVNTPERAVDIDRLRVAVARQVPFGSQGWIERVAGTLGMRSEVRGPGRPRK
jgi:putative transposase